MSSEMRPNADIEEIIQRAGESARTLKHEYVTLEHLSLAIFRNKNFQEVLIKNRFDIVALVAELDTHIQNQHHLVSSADHPPRKTQSLERVFNRALTQALFNNQKQIRVIDLLLSISAEHNSHAAYFLSNSATVPGMARSDFGISSKYV